jgi:hypothetical protein
LATRTSGLFFFGSTIKAIGYRKFWFILFWVDNRGYWLPEILVYSFLGSQSGLLATGNSGLFFFGYPIMAIGYRKFWFIIFWVANHGYWLPEFSESVNLGSQLLYHFLHLHCL